MTSFITRSGSGSMARRRASTTEGFTVIELMFVVVILTILITVAAPSMSNLVRDQRVKTAVGDVYAALAFARSEAIKRNVYVAVCSHNGSSGCQNSPDWGTYGWIIYLDADGNGYPGAVSDILKKQDPLPGLSLSGPGGNITYQGDGRLRVAPTPFVASISGNDAITVRCVRLDLSGRPNIQVDTNKSVAGCQ